MSQSLIKIVLTVDYLLIDRIPLQQISIYIENLVIAQRQALIPHNYITF